MNLSHKKILITGGNGQLAHDLIRYAKAYQYQVFAPSRQTLDICNELVVNAAMDHFKPDIVINAAAYTKVDFAEQEVLRVMEVNCEGAKNVAIACEKKRCLLIHVSTDYVFDGKATIPYRETDLVSPINIYGKSKLLGEQAIQQCNTNHIILRVSGVFGVHGINFVKTILRLAKEREVLRVVSDQLTCPTPSAAIAETLIKIADNPRQTGLFHYCSTPATSWHAFATAIINKARHHETLLTKTIEAIETIDYPTPAKRPHYSVLNCEKIEKTFDIKQPQWETGLNNVIQSLYSA